jgi:hypothetical protein
MISRLISENGDQIVLFECLIQWMAGSGTAPFVFNPFAGESNASGNLGVFVTEESRAK